MSWGGVLLSVLMALILVSVPGRGAQASSTNINWNGSDNSSDHTNYFPGFSHGEFGDDNGNGKHEGCCDDQSTHDSLKLNDSWSKNFDWSYQPGDTPHLYGDKFPISEYATELLNYIHLYSDSNGKPWSDFDFKGFSFTNYLSRDEYYDLHKYKYSSYEDFLNCDDYDDYVKHFTKYTFNYDPLGGGNQGTAPVPAAMPLMASVLAGGYWILRQRRRPLFADHA